MKLQLEKDEIEPDLAWCKYFLTDLSLFLQRVSSPSHSCFSGLVRAVSLRLCLDLQFPVDFIITAVFKTDITYHARNCHSVEKEIKIH